MVSDKKKVALKPSLQRIEDAQAKTINRIVEARLQQSPDRVVIAQLREERDQLKDMLSHLQMKSRVRVTKEYVFNMTDGVLELLREFLQEELNTMLRGGKNEKSRIYVNCQNELNVVLAEQDKRTKKATAESAPEPLADAA